MDYTVEHNNKMKMFSKIKKIPGWMVLELQTDGICVVHLAYIAHTAAPQVQLAIFYPLNPAPSIPADTAIETLLAHINKELHLNHYDCSHLLGPNEYQISSVEAPNVPQEELKTAVRWLLKDMLDYHIDDATIDVLGLPADKYAPGRKAMMYVISARNQLIAQRQNQFDHAQIPLKVIDIPELAQRNIANLIAPAERGIALLSLHASGALLTITFNDELYLARRLEINLNQLGAGQAEQQQTLLEKISLELQRTFDHVERQYPFISLLKLVLTPLTPELAELSVYLSTNLYIPVETLDLSTIFDFSLTPDLQQAASQTRFQMCLGAALRHEGKTL